MEALIVGGGVGGLATALALHRVGIRCRVYEAASSFRPAGAGINLHPHAMRELAELGLEPALTAAGVMVREFSFFNSHGQLIHSEPCGRFAGREFPQIAIHRPRLHAILSQAVRERLGPDAIVLGHRCIAVHDRADGAEAVFETDGATTRIRADALIAADGHNSTVRRQLHPQALPASRVRHTAWRGSLRRTPMLSGATIVLMGQFETGMITTYPVWNYADGSQLYSLTAITPTPDADGTGRDASPDEFVGRFKHWRFGWIDIPAMFTMAGTVRRHPLRDFEPIERWSFGHVTLLGDAAHPMTPRGGNGAAQALIDATTLARCLAGEPDPIVALARYQTERLPLANRIAMTNRVSPPDLIVKTVEDATGGRPFDNLDAVVNRDDLRRISSDYKRLTGATPA